MVRTPPEMTKEQSFPENIRAEFPVKVVIYTDRAISVIRVAGCAMHNDRIRDFIRHRNSH